MNNIDIRRKAAGAGVRLWQIAEELGITDSSFSRKLRKELTDAQKEEVFRIIDRLAGRSEA